MHTGLCSSNCLRYQVEEVMESSNGRDMLDSLGMTVSEDRPGCMPGLEWFAGTLSEHVGHAR